MWAPLGAVCGGRGPSSERCQVAVMPMGDVVIQTGTVVMPMGTVVIQTSTVVMFTGTVVTPMGAVVIQTGDIVTPMGAAAGPVLFCVPMAAQPRGRGTRSCHWQLSMRQCRGRITGQIFDYLYMFKNQALQHANCCCVPEAKERGSQKNVDTLQQVRLVT